MPLFSTALIASQHQLVAVQQLVGFLVDKDFVRAFDVRRRVLVRPPILPKMSPIEIAPICAPGMPGISNIGMPPEDCVSTSISLSLSSPARSFLRKESRVAALDDGPTSASSTRSSAACWARAATSLRLRSRTLHDRDLDEVADDLLDVAADITDFGELCRFNLDERARWRAWPADARSRSCRRRSGPIIKMFFGSTSSRSEPVSCSRRQRLRSAIDTAALGVGLADDEAVEFGDDFTGRKVGHVS